MVKKNFPTKSFRKIMCIQCTNHRGKRARNSFLVSNPSPYLSAVNINQQKHTMAQKN